VTEELTRQIVLSLVTVTVVLSSIESLVGYRVALTVGYGTYARPTSPIWSIARVLHGTRATLGVLFIGSIVSDFHSGVTDALIVILAILLAFSLHFQRMGQDGAERVAVMVFEAATVALLCGDAGNVLFLIFCAAQCSLAYGTAAVSKIRAPIWGKGVALLRIARTPDFGALWADALLTTHPFVAVTAERFLIALQLALACAWILPPPLAVFVLLGGLAFHALSAGMGGLYKFVWSFAALEVAALWMSIEIWGS
jgi:hypothetical protein